MGSIVRHGRKPQTIIRDYICGFSKKKNDREARTVVKNKVHLYCHPGWMAISYSIKWTTSLQFSAIGQKI